MPIHNYRQNIVLNVLIVTILESRYKCNRICSEWYKACIKLSMHETYLLIQYLFVSAIAKYLNSRHTIKGCVGLTVSRLSKFMSYYKEL
jgi:hypothetical protein